MERKLSRTWVRLTWSKWKTCPESSNEPQTSRKHTRFQQATVPKSEPYLVSFLLEDVYLYRHNSKKNCNNKNSRLSARGLKIQFVLKMQVWLYDWHILRWFDMSWKGKQYTTDVLSRFIKSTCWIIHCQTICVIIHCQTWARCLILTSYHWFKKKAHMGFVFLVLTCPHGCNTDLRNNT